MPIINYGVCLPKQCRPLLEPLVWQLIEHVASSSHGFNISTVTVGRSQAKFKPLIAITNAATTPFAASRRAGCIVRSTIIGGSTRACTAIVVIARPTGEHGMTAALAPHRTPNSAFESFAIRTVPPSQHPAVHCGFCPTPFLRYILLRLRSTVHVHSTT